MSGGRAPRAFGIHAETRLKTLLEGLGAIVMRTSMSQGPFDLLALGDGDIALIEVKATKQKKFYASKSPGTAQAVFDLGRIAEQCADNVLPVIAVWFERDGLWAFFTPKRVLLGPVGPEDGDLDLDNEIAFACVPPRDSSPSVGFPPPSEEDVRRIKREAEEV